MMLLNTSILGITLLITLVLKADCVHSEDVKSEYDYGDPNIAYDALPYDYSDNLDSSHRSEVGGKTLASKSIHGTTFLPLCCPKGEVYDQVECIPPPQNFDWAPKLDGSLSAAFAYSGFPKCQLKKGFVQTYQKEIHFSGEGKAFLPYYIQLLPFEKEEYCVAKIYDPSGTTCEDFQTKIFTCLNEGKEPEAVMWTAVSISHVLLFLTLVAYFCISELRCLQGQYMICFLISLLIYNLCLMPGSMLPMDVSDVSCIALGAVKYFFFCGVFLWFNTITFDIWRTLSNRQDISGRRRFLLYSAYSWVVGAILTTVVLVLPYMKDDISAGSRDDPLKDKNYEHCKLKLQMNMILQIAQLISLLLDLVFLILASCCVCGYTKFGNGLPRCDASLCLKQGWKLFIIMIAHVISCINGDLVELPIPLWLYILLEAVAIFGVFGYRRTVLRKIFKVRFCQSTCITAPEDGSLQEKGQLTMT